MIHLRWAKAKDGWLPLALPWPSVIDTVGVYVIWHEGNPSRVVRVGHGEIRERLHYHQEDPEVLAQPLRHAPRHMGSGTVRPDGGR